MRASPSSASHNPWHLWLAILVPMLLSGAAHFPALSGPFVFDDVRSVTRDPLVRELHSLDRYFAGTFWGGEGRERRNFYYRPLTKLSLALDQRSWGAAPQGFHATNLLIHLVTVGLVALVLLRIGASPLAAAGGSVWFGTFPRLTEAVSYVSGRTDLFAGLFVVAALGLILARRMHRPIVWWTVTGLLLLGLFGKEIAIAGFVAAIVRLITLREATDRDLRRHRRQGAFALTLGAAVYVVLRHVATDGAAIQVSVGEPIGQRLLLFTGAMGHYVQMVLDPFSPRFFTTLKEDLGAASIILGVFSLAFVAVGLGYAARKRHRDGGRTLVLMLTAIIPLIMVGHLVSLPVRGIVADRYLYLPLAALAVLAAWRLEPILRSRPYLVLLVGGYLVATALACWSRAEDWSSAERLWLAEVAASGRADPLPMRELGKHLYTQGEHGRALTWFLRGYRVEGTAGETISATDSDSGRASLLANIGVALSDLGWHRASQAILTPLVTQAPDQARHRYNLALTLARRGELVSAMKQIQTALELAPEYEAAQSLARQLRPHVSESTAADSVPDVPELRPSFWQWLDKQRRQGFLLEAETLAEILAHDGHPPPATTPASDRRVTPFEDSPQTAPSTAAGDDLP